MGKFDKQKWARFDEPNHERDKRIKRALTYLDSMSAMLNGVSYKLDAEIQVLREEFESLCKDTNVFESLKNIDIEESNK